MARLSTWLLFASVATLPTPGSADKVELRRLSSMGAHGEEPVASNVTTLRLQSEHTGDTGWLFQMEATFTRDPPVYGEDDESIDIGMLLMQYKGQDGQKEPPLRNGKVLKGEVYLQGQFVQLLEWKPLERMLDDRITFMANLHVMLGMASLQRIPNVKGDSVTHEFRLHGPMTIRVEVDLGQYGSLSAEVTCILEEPRQDPWIENWSVAPQSGLLGHCLREVHYDDGCWRYIRQRLFATPLIMTQTELAVAALSSGTFFGHENTPALRAKFPVRDPARLTRYRTCAVVGSGGHILNTSLGTHIDQHDVVIRFNEAPTKGFETDVGTRTTHRIVHFSKSIQEYLGKIWANQNVRENLLFLPLFNADIDEFFLWLERNGGIGVQLFSTTFLHYAWRLLSVRDNDKIPTSGFLGVLWAMESCDQVDTYALGYYRERLHADDERCWATKDNQVCLAPPKSPDLGAEGIHRYAYFVRHDPRPWSYGYVSWGVAGEREREREREREVRGRQVQPNRGKGGREIIFFSASV